jgi:hypothetical protein
VTFCSHLTQPNITLLLRIIEQAAKRKQFFSEFRQLGKVEQAVKYLQLNNASPSKVQKDTKVSRSAIIRGLKASAAGREIGKKGRPTKLNEEQMNIVQNMVLEIDGRYFYWTILPQELLFRTDHSKLRIMYIPISRSFIGIAAATGPGVKPCLQAAVREIISRC